MATRRSRIEAVPLPSGFTLVEDEVALPSGFTLVTSGISDEEQGLSVEEIARRRRRAGTVSAPDPRDVAADRRHQDRMRGVMPEPARTPQDNQRLNRIAGARETPEDRAWLGQPPEDPRSLVERGSEAALGFARGQTDLVSKWFQNLDDRVGRVVGGVIQALPQIARSHDLGATVNRSLLEGQMQRDGMTAQQATEALDSPAEEWLRGAGRGVFERASRELERNDPNVSGLLRFQYDLMNAFVDVGAAMTVTAATRSPTAGAAVIGVQVFGDRYGESISQGRTPEQAFQDGIFYAIPEAIGERIVIGRLMRPGGRISRAANGAVSEGVQEMVTESLQSAYDAGIIGEDMTVGEAFKRILYAGAVGGAAGAGIGLVAGPVRNRVGMTEEARSTQPSVTPEDIASPLPTEEIASGKAIIEEALAGSRADDALDENIGHRRGDRVTVTVGEQMREGTIKDAFEEDDPETGKQQGAVIEWDGGGESRERFADLEDAGARIERPTGPRVATPRDDDDDVPRETIRERPGIESASERETFRQRVRSAESGGNDQARNPRSSASGRYQFTTGTFLSYHRRVYGGQMSDAERLRSKDDPAVQERLMDALTDDNERALRQARQPVTAGNLYLSHFLGSGGATAVLRNPDAPIEQIVGQSVVTANPFLRGMTGRDVAAWAESRMGGEHYAGADSSVDYDTVEPDYSWIDQAAAPPAEIESVEAPLVQPERTSDLTGSAGESVSPIPIVAATETFYRGVSDEAHILTPGDGRHGDMLGAGLYVTNSPEYAGKFGNIVAPVKIATSNIVNEWDIPNAGSLSGKQVNQWARAHGFDGIRRLVGNLDGGPEVFDFVIFDPAKVSRAEDEPVGTPSTERAEAARPQITVERSNVIIRDASESDVARVNEALPGQTRLIPRSDGAFVAPKKYEAAIRTVLTGDGTREAPVQVAETADIARAEQQVETAPTEAQKAANNFRAGHIRFQGLDITIETPKGAERSGTNQATGERWSVTMPTTYGRIKRSDGADGEQVDVYVGPEPTSLRAFVIDQVDLDTREYDESKVMLGYRSKDAALADYRAAFSDGRGDERIGAVTGLSVESVRDLVKRPQTEPVGSIGSYEPAAAAPATQPAPEIAVTAASEAFDPAPLIPAMREYVAGAGSLNDLAKIGRALGVTPEQAEAVLYAAATRPDSGIYMSQGRPAGTRRILVSPAVQKLDKSGRKLRTVKAASYKTVEYRSASPARWLRLGDREGNLRGAPKAPRTKRKLSLAEFVAARGGVYDDGGELASMDAGKWHKGKPFRGRLIRPRPTGFGTEDESDYSVGRVLEEAIAAGYFPNLDARNFAEADTVSTVADDELIVALRNELLGSPIYPQEETSEEDADFGEEEARREISGIADTFDLNLSEDEIDLAMEYMRQGMVPVQAITAATVDRGAETLDEIALDAYAGEAESLSEQEEAGDEGDDGARDLGVAPGVARPEGAETAAPESRPADEEPREAQRQVATASEQDMFGTQPGNERRALERAGEGRLKSEAAQKAPGSDENLFDQRDTTGDLEDVSTTALQSEPVEENVVTNELQTPVEQAKAMLQGALDVLNGKPAQEAALRNTSLMESLSDSAAGDTKLLRDTAVSPTFRAEGLSGFDIPTQAAVLKQVFSAAQDRKIFDAIIRLLPVDVVNVLATRQLTPEMLLHDEAMLVNLPSALVGSDPAIPPLIDVASSFVEAAATAVAEQGATPANEAGMFVDGGAALGAVGEGQAGSPNPSIITPTDGPRYQRRLLEGDDPVFYSALERALERDRTRRASASQWAAMLGRVPGVKKEELEWSGIFDFLDMQEGPVSRDELLAVIRDGGIKVEEVVLGEPGDPAAIQERAQELWYAEVLKQSEDLIERRPDLDPDEVREQIASVVSRAKFEDWARDEIEPLTKFENWTSDPGGETYRELLITLPIAQGGNPTRDFATHWDEPAVIAHARFMEKRDADGKRVLFIEEVQSDRGQAGRDQGFAVAATPEQQAEAETAYNDAVKAYNEAGDAIFTLAQSGEASVSGRSIMPDQAPSGHQWDQISAQERYSASNLALGVARLTVEGETTAMEATRAYGQARLRLSEAEQALENTRGKSGVPDMPFKSSWPALVMKRTIRWAVDNGFERVAWATGAEQAERYNLTQAVGTITAWTENDGSSYNVQVANSSAYHTLIDNAMASEAPGSFDLIMKPDQLRTAFGENIARQIIDGAAPTSRSGGEMVRLTNDDLRVGGEGMKAFYDRNLVNITNDLIKKYGGKVEQIDLAIGNRLNEDPRGATPEIREFERQINERMDEGTPFPDLQSELLRLRKEWKEGADLTPHPGFEITPAMADAARSGFPLFALRRIQSQPVTVADEKAIAERLQTELDQLGISDRIALKAANGLLTEKSAQGAFFRRVIQVSLDMAIDPSRTFGHEAYHALKAIGVVMPSEHTALVKAAWADPEIAEFVKKGGYAKLSDAKRDEEAAAEYVGRFIGGRMELQAKGFVGRALVRVADFLNALSRAVAWVKGDRSVKASRVLRDIAKGKVGRRETGAGLREDGEAMMQEGEEGFGVDPEQTGQTPEQQRQRAEIEARLKQSKIGRLGQKSLGDQAGGLFDIGRDQGMLFQKRPDPALWNEMLNRTRSLTGAAKTPGKTDAFAAAWDRFRTNFQDRMLPIMRTETAIERFIGRELSEEEKPYRQEALYTGRVGAQFEQLEDKLVGPMFEAMQEEGVTTDELESYLYARHAPERNKKLKAEGVDDGSGMSDIEAAAIMSRIEKSGKREALERVSKWFDDLNAFALDTRVAGGLMAPEEAAEWRQQWKHYAPLRGHLEVPEDERPNVGGKGYTVRGPESRRAFGRKSKADDILAHAIMQAEEAVVRAEKNRVAVELYNLAKASPDPNFWQVQKVSMKKRVNKETGLVETYPVTVLLPEDAPFTVSLKLNGKGRRVTFNKGNPAAVRAAAAMRRMNEPELAIRTFQIINRWLSKANTTLNPDFIWRNAFRDLETATANLSQFDVKGLRRSVIAAYPKALKAATRGAFKAEAKTEWDQAWQEFTAQGGRVFYNQVQDVGELRSEIEKRFAKLTRERQSLSPKQWGMDLWTGLKWTFDKIEKANLGVENAVRLSAYKNLRDRGVTKKQAAFIAKELTTNFNRRGVYGVLLNSAYLFMNATTQGSARMLMALRHPRTQKIAATMIVVGAMNSLFNVLASGADDDDELYYDQISDYEKSTNLIFMIPGSSEYVKIPVAYGYNIFFELGRHLTDLTRGRSTALEASAGWLFTVANSFNPIGGQESLANFLAPTIADPAVDLVVDNRDYADRPIMPDIMPFDRSPPPDSQRFWPSVNPLFRRITDALNLGTGGDNVRPGWVDISPESIEYLTQYATGAAGATITRIQGAVSKSLDGDPTTALEVNDIPIVRTMVGTQPSWYARAAFYTRLEHVEEVVGQARQYRADQNREGLRSLVEDEADVLRVRGAARTARRDMRQIRKARNQLETAIERDRITDERADALRLRLQEREERLFSNFSSIYLETVEQPRNPQR